jgi:hypothetical protein
MPMKLQSIVELFATGTSEGVKKAWDTRGRGRKEKELNPKQQRAIASYSPITKDKLKIALENELKIAKMIGGQHIPDNAPFDVRIGNKALIEVKTIMPTAKNDKITVHPTPAPGETLSSKDRKILMGKQEGLSHNMVAVAVNMRPGSEGIYVRRFNDPNDNRPGWSFRTFSMTKVSNPSDLRKLILSGKSLEVK